MTLSCQNCGEELSNYPREAVESGDREEVVSHTFEPEDSLAISETSYYCDPDCFVESEGDSDE